MGLWDSVVPSASTPSTGSPQASSFWHPVLSSYQPQQSPLQSGVWQPLQKPAPMLPGLGGPPQSTFSFNPILDNSNEQSKTFLQRTLGPISNFFDRVSGAIIAPMAKTPLEKVNGIYLPQKFSSQVESGAENVFGKKIGGPVAAGVSLIGDPLNLVGGEGAKGIELLTKMVTAAKTEGEVTKLMKGAGFADDIISHYAPVLAKTTDATKVREGLLAAENLHNSTTATRSLNAAYESAGTGELSYEKPGSVYANEANLSKVERALGHIKMELEIAEPGYRVISDRTHGSMDSYGVPSSFPQWIPEELRSKKLFDKVLSGLEPGNITFPPARNVKQRRLFQLLLDEVDKATGVDTSAIRESIMRNERSQAPGTQGRIRGSAAGGEAAGGIPDTKAINTAPRVLSAESEKLTGVRDSLAENLKAATTPAKKAAIQSQIDLIDKKLSTRLPPTVGEVLSTRPVAELAHATPPPPLETAPRELPPEAPRTSDLTSPQGTTQKIDLSVKGVNSEERVRNAIGRSQTLKTQIVNKGQEAYLAGRGLSNDDLAVIRDGYQAGKPIAEIAKGTADPAKATAFLEKLASYYDYELAADRAAGGETPRVQNYLPQYWDLSNPVDKARWDEFAKQRGMQPYYGFRSQSKIFKSYAEGIAAGFTPAHENILEDLKANYGSASNAISTQALKRGLSEAAPKMVGMSGLGITPEGKSFVNSNIPGLEGIAYHPTIDKMLQGFQPLKHADFIDLVKKSGAEAALEHVGVMGQIDKMVAMAKSAPANAKEAGLGGVLGSIYDHVTGPMKQVLWNWSGFHSVNITLSHMGASTLHPITGTKGVLQSVGSAVSERLYRATVESYKNLTVGKDAEGAPQSVFDWAVESGAYEPRDLPAVGLEHFHPFSGGQRVIFDREIPVLQLNLAEQAARKGIVASSPEGIALGKEIRAITGEINAKTMNINPNTLKAASRAFLAPGFTFSKYKTLLDSFTAWGSEHGAAGNLARQAVIGKSAIVGVAATLGTLLATGKFPNLQQLLMNFSFNPSVQTTLTNPKGRRLDITFPKTFLAEGASAILNPVAYGNARLNPLISDMLKLYTNQDYYGQPLVDPNVHTSTALQLAQNLGIGHLPIGAQAVINTMMGKQTAAQGAIQVGGLGTHVSPTDPVMVKYAGIDQAKTLIAGIAPDDPNRLQKMQAIFNGLPEADRKSLAYQELLAGVSTKGVYQSENERKYFQIQDLVQKGDTAGATAITKAMSKQEYSAYKSIKTRLAHAAAFQQVKDLVAKGDMQGATALTAKMTKQEYASYQTWKKNNP